MKLEKYEMEMRWKNLQANIGHERKVFLLDTKGYAKAKADLKLSWQKQEEIS